jgi:hypothetical protein
MINRLLLGGFVAALLASGCSSRSDRGAYDVVKHYSVPCAGRGGFAEYVIVRSHRVADLNETFRRWYTTNRHDASKCLYLFAFSSPISRAVFEHETLGLPKTYSGKERDAARLGLFYLNDPNKHTESWISADGRLHNGGPASV